MLRVLDHLPTELLGLAADELHRVLPGPSLIHLAGRRPQPLLVTVLLHGNETTGWLAVRELLRRYQDQEMPRGFSLFIGNVRAAREGKRFLPGQPDFNRIWAPGEGPEHGLAQQVFSEMEQRQIFASVDIHNNTGINPHYAIVASMAERNLHLAGLFSRTVVYAITPDNTNTVAFAQICPAVTVECGQPGQERGVTHTIAFLDACLNLHEFPSTPVSAQDLDLYHTVAVVKVPEHISIGYGNDADLNLLPDIDSLNFTEVRQGTVLGTVGPGNEAVLRVRDVRGTDAGPRFFTIEDGEIRAAVSFMPAMLTRDPDMIRMDCLCYLMQRVDRSRVRKL